MYFHNFYKYEQQHLHMKSQIVS